MEKKLCADIECAPPFGAKEDCDLCENGYCCAPSREEAESKHNELCLNLRNRSHPHPNEG